MCARKVSLHSKASCATALEETVPNSSAARNSLAGFACKRSGERKNMGLRAHRLTNTYHRTIDAAGGATVPTDRHGRNAGRRCESYAAVPHRPTKESSSAEQGTFHRAGVAALSARPLRGAVPYPARLRHRRSVLADGADRRGLLRHQQFLRALRLPAGPRLLPERRNARA